MIYKNLFVVTLTLLFSQSYLFSQISLYVEYDNICMTKMEYGEIGKISGQALTHYYAFEETDPSKKIILETAPSKLQKGVHRPPSVMDCSEVTFNQKLIDRVNMGELQIYIVTKGATNYDLHFIESLSRFEHVGSYVDYRTFEYGFQHDYNAFNPGKNLSTNTNMYDISYRGDNGFECMNTYTYRKASTNTCGTHTDITVCPDIGIVKWVDGSKFDPTDAAGTMEKYELKYINNLPLDNYIGAACQGVYPNDPTLIVDTNPIPSTTTTSGSAFVVTNNNSATVVANPDGVPVIAAPPRPTPMSTVVSVANLPKPGTSSGTIRDYPDFTNGIPGDGGDLLAAKGGDVKMPKISNSNLVPECGVAKRAGFHVVRPSESLSIIAQKTGISITDLARWNNIGNLERIEACSELRLTAPNPDMYDSLVEKGGTISVPKPGGVKMPKISNKNVNKKPEAESEEIEGWHIVQEGETVYQLAKKHGYTVEKFMEFNGLETDVISPGMQLKLSNCSCAIPEDFTAKGEEEIPSSYDIAEFTAMERKLSNTEATGKTHILQEQETLYQISKQYNISVEKLMLINEIDDPTTLSVGESIVIE